MSLNKVENICSTVLKEQRLSSGQRFEQCFQRTCILLSIGMVVFYACLRPSVTSRSIKLGLNSTKELQDSCSIGTQWVRVLLHRDLFGSLIPSSLHTTSALDGFHEGQIGGGSALMSRRLSGMCERINGGRLEAHWCGLDASRMWNESGGHRLCCRAAACQKSRALPWTRAMEENLVKLWQKPFQRQFSHIFS